ncbi:MAG: DNA repair protein RecN [bacterium]|nr:DNA repair protein RecN [bacterium]
MLKKLYIENYTIMSRVEVVFQPGLNVITGETGVGKSLLLDALGSLVGEKRSGMPIRSGAERAIVEAEFDANDKNAIQQWLQTQNLPTDFPIIVRREFHQNGRNRFFVNDTPASLGAGRELGDLLLDIHGQHETVALFSRSRQLLFLDAFHHKPELSIKYRDLYRCIKSLSNEAESLKMQIEDSRAGSEVYRRQLTELNQLDPQENEITALEAELNRLENAEKIFQICKQIEDYLNEASESAVEQLDRALRLLPELYQFNTDLKIWESEVSSLRSVLIEFNRTLQEFSREVSHDPNRVEDLRQRVVALYGFQKRWGYSGKDLVLVLAEISQKLNELALLEVKAQKISAEISTLNGSLIEAGRLLSEQRQSVAELLKVQVEERLRFIGMSRARFAVQFDPINIENPYEDGLDRLEFVLSPDGKLASLPLRQVASGGEMSRILLALKSALAQVDPVESLIFDEIDQGISGRIAHLVGLQLAELGRMHQVILVTHLPQIASQGDVHWSVRRDGPEGAAVVHRLDGEERVIELASLLIASGITDGALLNAREMLQAARNQNQTV